MTAATQTKIDEAFNRAFTKGNGQPDTITVRDLRVRMLHASYSFTTKQIAAWLADQERLGNVECVGGDTWRRVISGPQEILPRESTEPLKAKNYGPTRARRIDAPPQSEDSADSIDLPRELPVWFIKYRQQQENELAQWKRKYYDMEKTGMDHQRDDMDLVPYSPPAGMAVVPQMSITDLKERENFIYQVVTEVLKPGVHYGPSFPGSKDLALWQEGANVLSTIFGLFPDPIEVEKVIRRADGSILTEHISYEYRCDLHLGSRNGPVVGSAIAVCSTDEDRYKWRTKALKCPSCGQETIRKGAERFGGGWYCNRKDGGCGKSYKDGDASIESQDLGKVVNPDMMGLQHTIAAMAQKRAFILAIRRTTGVGAYFSDAVVDEEPTARPNTINGTATVKNSASAWSRTLIDYAESLLPVDHGYTKAQIGAACLDAMGIKTWSDEYDGSEDDAKRAIAGAINEKFGNGKPTPPDAPKTAPKSGDTPPEDTSGNGDEFPTIKHLWGTLGDDLLKTKVPSLPEDENIGKIVYPVAKDKLGYADADAVKAALKLDSLKSFQGTLEALLARVIDKSPVVGS